MESMNEYLAYVDSVLASVSNDIESVHSYDTGFGLHIVDTFLGNECMGIDVVSHSVAKIRTPKIKGEDWFQAWSVAVSKVNAFINQRNKQ